MTMSHRLSTLGQFVHQVPKSLLFNVWSSVKGMQSSKTLEGKEKKKIIINKKKGGPQNRTRNMTIFQAISLFIVCFCTQRAKINT